MGRGNPRAWQLWSATSWVGAFDGKMASRLLVSSNGDARRQVKAGGLRVNDTAVSDEKMTLTSKNLTTDGVIKLSLGKKKHVLLKPV